MYYKFTLFNYYSNTYIWSIRLWSIELQLIENTGMRYYISYILGFIVFSLKLTCQKKKKSQKL